MLIHDFVQVSRPFDEVRTALATDAVSLLAGNADAAYSEGERLWLRLAPVARHPGLGKRVHVDLGRLYERGDGLVMPIHWWASGVTALFPRLDADLEVAPVGREATQLTLMGRYDPPLMALGEHLDRLLMHRLAEASVRSFLQRVAGSLTSDRMMSNSQRLSAQAS